MTVTYVEIEDFPGYLISDHGDVWNCRLDREQARSKTGYGDYKVSLVNEIERATLSVRVLVAEAFVEPPDEFSNTVIVLNNNREDVRAENLAWRPGWFAWRYSHQFSDHIPAHFKNVPILNTKDEIEYSSITECAMVEGLLFEDLWRAVNIGDRIYPTGANYVIL